MERTLRKVLQKYNNESFISRSTNSKHAKCISAWPLGSFYNFNFTEKKEELIFLSALPLFV